MFLFGTTFLVLFVYALLTGRAYVRGWVRRDESPGRYWMAVGVYAALAALLFSLAPTR